MELVETVIEDARWETFGLVALASAPHGPRWQGWECHTMGSRSP
jgi:hypothetical protein